MVEEEVAVAHYPSLDEEAVCTDVLMLRQESEVDADDGMPSWSVCVEVF